MSLFEFLMVLVSIIIGLGIAEILTGIARQIRCRSSIQGYWVHSILDKNGDPPALLGRHQQFDSNRSLIVTPKREPTSNTLRRNHETSKKFKPHAMGV